MITFDEAAVILDDLIEELPDGIYEKLNGGVNLIEEAKHGKDGDYIMGLYHVDEMGRYIEIFYGSFVELYGDIDQDRFTEELRKTLRHELTHHVENMAGDRTLEKWDEEQAEKRKYGTIKADSILFVDDDGSALAQMANAMFRQFATEKCSDVRTAAACLNEFGGKYNQDAADASAQLGAPLHTMEAPLAARDVVLKDYDVILCMTMAQANALYQRFPQFDEQIMCLGETDIKTPLFRHGWKKTAARMKEEIGYLIEELCEDEEQ
jgi:protein-tyrosine-phosphatase